MIDRGRARRGRHRRAHDGARRPRARRHRARPAGPRREAARRDRGGGDRARGRGPGPRRPAPGRPRRALQPGRPRARPAARRRAGSGTLYSITSRRAGPFPARIRDVGVTIDLATHDADILSWVAGERPTRVYAETAQRLHATQRGPAVRAAPLPVGCDRHARRQLAHARRSGASSRSWARPGMFELDYLTQRLTFTSADVGSPTIIDGYATTFEGNVVVIDVASREPLAAELDAFLAVARSGGRPVVDGEDGLWALAIASGLLAGRGRGPPGRPRRLRARGCPRSMTITDRPTSSASLLGGTITSPENPCLHGPARSVVARGPASPGTAGTVTVVGAGKMGLPLAAQFASHGWPSSPSTSNADGRRGDQRGPGPRRRGAGPRRARRGGPRRRAPARDDRRRRGRARVRRRRADRAGHARRRAAARLPPHGRRRRRRSRPGVRAGATVIFETTLPVGDTRNRYVPLLEAATGLVAERDLFVAFSPERLFSGAVFRNLATYPKLVGGIGPASTDRAARFYASVLDAEVVAMSSRRGRRAEQARRHDVPRRQHRVRQRARGVRRPRRRRRPGGHPGGQQPAVQPHPPARPRRRRPLHPGLPALPPVAGARDGAGRGVAPGQRRPGRRRGRSAARRARLRSADVPVLVLGLTYREGVKELAYSRALPLIERLRGRGRPGLGLGPAAVRRGDRALRGRRRGPGERRATRARSSCRPPTRCSAGLDPAWFPDARGRPRRPEQPARRRVPGPGPRPRRGRSAARRAPVRHRSRRPPGEA